MIGVDSFIKKGYLSIEGAFIKELGEGKAPEGKYDRIINGENQVLLPGFINAHTHAAMSLLRGYADDLPLMEWLESKIWPLEAKLTPEYIYWGSMLAIVEMIKSGTTTFNDMYFCMDEVARAVELSGMRAVLARGMIGAGPESEQALEDSRELVGKWQGKASGRISFWLGPHAPYTCSPDYLERIMQLADELQTGIHIHVAETPGEYENIRRQYGKTPVAHLATLGLFRGRQVLAAHCVYLDEGEIGILRENKVGVAHNPESNMKLASGIAPVPLMLESGIAVALGTDGASSNNNLDMLQEMRSAALLHKVNKMDPTVLPAYQALEMATANGGISLGMGAELGRLQPGFRADMIIMDLTEAHMIPCYDLLANIVYSAQASDVKTVIINGEIVMENREIKTFDEREVLAKARETARKLVG